MRLRQSRPSAQETLIQLLTVGYRLGRRIYADYDAKRQAGTFNPEKDVVDYQTELQSWIDKTHRALLALFPTDMEASYFVQLFSVSAADYSNIDTTVGRLIYERIPTYVARLERILQSNLDMYLDLPMADRIFVEDVDSFSKGRGVNPAMVAPWLKDGRLELSEEEVQMALESILEVPFHRKDWGGETNDLYTANVVLNGIRRSTAFLLKGRGLRSQEMTLAECGKNGDQIQRLFRSPAELFVVQYVGPIADAVISDLREKVALKRSAGTDANFLLLDGQDTARLLYAYGKLGNPQVQAG